MTGQALGQTTARRTIGLLREETWLIAALVVFLVAAGLLIIWSESIPFVLDGNETFSSIVHAQNMYRFGIGESFGLTDEAYGPDPAAHPFVYTHQGNFPRIFAYVIWALGASSVGLQVVVTTVVIGSAAVFFTFRFFGRWLGPAAAFLISIIFITDYIMLLQWNLVTYRVWHLFFFFGALCLVDRCAASRSVVLWMPVIFLFYLALFYFELMFATFTAVCAGLYTIFVTVPSIGRTITIVVGQLFGAVSAILLLTIQNVLYLGVRTAFSDALLTFQARNNASPDPQFIETLRDFYSSNDIVFWFNVIDNTDARWPVNILSDVIEFGCSVLPPILYISGFMMAFGWLVRALRQNAGQETWGWLSCVGCFAVITAILLVLAVWHVSPQGNWLMASSSDYAVGVLLMALVLVASVSPLVPRRAAVTVLAPSLSRAGLVRLFSLGYAGMLALVAAYAVLTIVTGRAGGLAGPAAAALAVVGPLLVSALAIGAAFRRRLFARMMDAVSVPQGVQALSLAAFVLFAGFMILLPLGIGTRPTLVLATAGGMLSLLAVILARSGGIAEFLSSPHGVCGAATLLRIVAAGAMAVSAALAFFFVLAEPIPHSVAMGAVLSLAAVFLFVLVLSATWPSADSRAWSVTVAGLGLTAVALVALLVIARWAWVSQSAEASVIPVVLGLFAVLAGTRWWLARFLAPAACATALAICLYAAHGGIAHLAGGAEAVPSWSVFEIGVAVAALLLGAVPIVQARGATTPLLLMALILAAFSVALRNAATLFPVEYAPLWRVLALVSEDATLMYVLAASSFVAALHVALSVPKRDADTAIREHRLMWFLVAAVAGYLFVVFLTPGYVRTGYLERYVPLTVFVIDSFLALGALAAARAVRDIARRGGVARDDGGDSGGRRRWWGATSLAPGAAAVVFLAVWMVSWSQANIALARLAPPDRFSFLHRLAEAPYAGRSAVVNTYAAPVSVQTGQWAYFDPLFQNAEIDSAESGTTFRRDESYLWFADKEDARYEKPDYFVCMVPRTIVDIMRSIVGEPTSDCSRVNLVHRAATLPQSEQQFGPAASIAMIDERPSPAWAVVRLDWTPLPQLEPLSPDSPERVDFTWLVDTDGSISVAPVYRLAGGVGNDGAGARIRVYGAEDGCPSVSLADLTLLDEREDSSPGDHIALERDIGSVVVSVQTRRGERIGPEFLSQALNLGTGERCPVSRDPGLSLVRRPDGETALIWSGIPGTHRYEIRMAIQPLDAPAQVADEWTHFGMLPGDQRQYVLPPLRTGYRYLFRLIACDEVSCDEGHAADQALVLTSEDE